ncbi:hypothetical protein ACWD6R_25515 [Streptomyces sp. NPDC005151]
MAVLPAGSLLTIEIPEFDGGSRRYFDARLARETGLGRGGHGL